MTKTICVSQSKFKKCLGYGIWSVITITLLTILIASVIEINGIHDVPARDFNDYHAYYPHCYKNAFDNIEHCFSNHNYWDFNGWPFVSNIYSIIGNSINLGVIGLWIYVKQQKFKFSWCLKDGSESL